jgi:Outer membrane protein and related peptidoglycan-associated (lipo)proteins
MKIRLILLSIAGLAAYVVLANFNSNITTEAVAPTHRNQVTAPPVHADKHTAETTPALISPPPEQPQTQQQPAASPATAELQQLLEELARKDLQIKQLLDAQEAIIARDRPLLDATAETTEPADKQPERDSKHIEALATEKEQLAAELAQTRTLVEQLRQECSRQQKHATEAADKITALSADREKIAAELQQAKSGLQRMQHRVAAMQAAGVQDKQVIKEKETLLAAAQQQIQEQTGVSDQLRTQLAVVQQQIQEQTYVSDQLRTQLAAAQQQFQEQTGASNQIKAQLAETEAVLAVTKQSIEHAELKAIALVRLSAEKEQQVIVLNEQKAAMEQAFFEKNEALDHANLTSQSLREELAAQTQAVTEAQRLLNERTQEFERVNKEAAQTIEQLNNQVAALDQNNAQTAKNLELCVAEAENIRKETAELEAARTKIQLAQTEAEQKLAAALESNATLQAKLTEKTTAFDSAQININELTAATTSLHNEKIGLASQLQALLADHSSLLSIKQNFEKQSASLAEAEAKLQEMAELQAKNVEMNNSLAEKDTALAQAAKQADALTALQARFDEATGQAETNAAAIKQLEREKSELADKLTASQDLARNIDDLKNTVDEKNKALAAAESKAKKMATAKEEQIAAAQMQATEARTALLTAEKNVAERETALKHCNESLTANNSKVEKLQSELGEVQARTQKMTEQTEAKNDEIKAAHQKTQILQTERDGLQQTLAASQATISDLQKQLEAVSTQQQPQAAVPSQSATPVQSPQPVTQVEPQPPAAPATQVEQPLQATAQTEPPTGQQTTGTDTGVTDGANLCPNVPAGVPVNVLGCPQGQGIVLEGVAFASGTAALTPAAQKALDQIAVALALVPQAKVEVAGYTDNVGDTNRNQRLSTQRARSVTAYLTAQGIAATRLTAKGYGPENPISDNATADGRQKNRRIELHIIAP